MIFIRKGDAPKALEEAVRELRETPDAAPDFSRLDGRTKKVVLDALLNEQGHLCAYCMARIGTDANHASIEHIVAQHGEEGLARPYLSVDYGNMLAVCDGAQGETCDKHRGNVPMKVTPLDEKCMGTIHYGRDGTIHSHDTEIEHDLNVTLNLNSPRTYLRQNRKSVQRKVNEYVCRRIRVEGIEGNPKAKARLCRKLIEHCNSQATVKEEFIGVKIFVLERLERKFIAQI